MDTTTMFAIRQLVESLARASKGNTVASKQLAIVLRGIEGMGSDAHTYALHLVRLFRKDPLEWATLRQREWGSKVSNRPGRGNHHDSWATREKYVRCSGDYSHFLPYAHSVLIKHPKWEVVACRPRRVDSI